MKIVGDFLIRLCYSISTMTDDVTHILNLIGGGDPGATDQLLPLVYHELKRLAAAKMVEECPDHTLQATALVHEAYVRLVGTAQGQAWNGRAHFFTAAAEAMRRVLVGHARTAQRQKRGGHSQRIALQMADALEEHSPDELLSLNEAIDQLAQQDPELAELVKLRVFAGFGNQEAAEVLSIPMSTAKKHWLYARAWLRRILADD